jgi:Domain of unknown function (DUF4062)
MSAQYKKYQIFISSTFEDLKAERKAIFEAILEDKQIPAGMELFATSEKSQWEYIVQRIIDCDYYVLIIGHKYGSTDSEGISFTEKEYNFAIENSIPIMAFVIDQSAPVNGYQMEPDPEKLKKLQEFKVKVKSNGRMCKFFNNKDQLKSDFKTSLHEYISDYPRIGWVRSDSQEIADRIRTKDIEFIQYFLIKQIDTLINCILASINEIGKTDNLILKFNTLHNMFNPTLDLNSLNKEVFEVLIETAKQLNSDLQFLLSNQHISIGSQFANHFMDYIKFTTPHLANLKFLDSLRANPEPKKLLKTMIQDSTEVAPSYEETQGNLIRLVVIYFDYIKLLNNWLIEYQRLISEQVENQE